MKTVTKKLRRRARFQTFISLFLALAAVPIFFLIRARFLPDVEVPILLYERVARIANDASTIPVDLFHLQMNDLSRSGYRTVSPKRLKAYKMWGFPLPEKPIIITFDNAYRSLLAEVAMILREQEFTAVIFLATTYLSANPGESHSLNGEPMMTWNEVRLAMKEKIFEFGGHTRNLVDLTRHVKPFNEIRASRSDIKHATGVRSGFFSYPGGRYSQELARAARKAKIDVAMMTGDTIAKIGPKTDLLALPRLRVVGGRHAFTANIVERQSPGFFGVIRVTHPTGPDFPSSIVAYGSGTLKPDAEFDVDAIRPGEIIEFPLPVGVQFPIEIEILEKNRILLYFSNMVPKNAVIRDLDPAGMPVAIDFPLDIDPVF